MIRFYGCVHCTQLIYPEPELLEKLDLCHSCDSNNMNRWLCLTSNCGYIGCGQKSYDHSKKHFQNTRHPVAINLYNHKVYCSSCQKQVFSSSGTDKESGSTRNGTVRTTDDLIYSHNQMDGGYDERPLGLVGLKNLGNTCYMNAALQCLLNVPQLTEYFESTHPSFFEDKNHILSRQYQNLVGEIFDYKRKTYVIPTGVSHTIKAIYPPFRGYLQQDAQEFLRVLMDKLHTETKYCVKMAPSAASTSAIVASAASESGDSSVTGTKSRSRERQWRSIVSDIFQGQLSNSIKCLQCERISCNEDFFEDLSLPIASSVRPPTMQLTCGGGSGGGEGGSRSVLRAPRSWWPWNSGVSSSNTQSPQSASCCQPAQANSSAAAVSLLYFQFCWIISFLAWIKNWFLSRTVTLEQCLELFFCQDELKGDNKYSCDKCQGHQNAVMQSKLVVAPEILCLHLKRFKNDFGCSKITTAVTFPIDGLDLTPYLHHSHKNQVWLYDLIGVICHLGSGGSASGGGHYLSYVLNWRSQTWYEFDDDQVNEVDFNVVLALTSSAYVLFYKKRDDHMLSIRETADKLLKTTLNESIFKYYLARSWVVKFNTFAEPGPINNWEFLCPHGAVQPEKVVCVHETTIELSQKTWAYLSKQGPTCTSLLVCQECEKKCNKLNERRQFENLNFSKLHKTFESSLNKRDVHVLSLKWFRQWEEFVKGAEDDVPVPIDNSDILVAAPTSAGGGGPAWAVNTNSDYGWISADTWRFLHDIYGGGPAHNVCPSGHDGGSGGGGDSDCDSEVADAPLPPGSGDI